MYRIITIILITVAAAIPEILSGQILSRDNSSSFTSKNGVDPVYIFNDVNRVGIGDLYISETEATEIIWSKYNPTSNSYSQIGSTGDNLSISNLGSGLYQIQYKVNNTQYQFYADVVNSWLEITATITESTCEYFRIEQEVSDQSEFSYIDRSTLSSVEIDRNFQFRVTSLESSYSGNEYYNYEPPAEDTEYTYQVTDEVSKSSAEHTVLYNSIVPKADGDWNSDQENDSQLEAPALITFENLSINSTSVSWFLYKNEEDLSKLTSENNSFEDSILTTITSEQFTYQYEEPGSYKVAVKATRDGVEYECTDQYELSPIVIDSSMVSIMEVFSPNGDGINDLLIVTGRSLKTINVEIFNRWGNRLHRFSKTNIASSTQIEEAAWDGKSGGRYAKTGVYFFTIEAIGRDNKKRSKVGSIHLFN